MRKYVSDCQIVSYLEHRDLVRFVTFDAGDFQGVAALLLQVLNETHHLCAIFFQPVNIFLSLVKCLHQQLGI